ncbi:hypothetical protein [Methylibium petroleiphilum]|uniref:hypothetical protein n=1 Tax=Methylibium petroleiphilum TaxID=105560 RepID=UPI001ACAD91C|nr:hypothetical protein [Methylibium petroleiphilum]MBN9206676.1 hypothetical protein [Methylibium petroleiphilum]
MQHLKKALFEAYDGFADKRIKDLEKSALFIVDGRGPGDYAADKSLFLWFCAVHVEVKSETQVVVRLSGGVPTSPGVKAWAKENGAKIQTTPVATLSVAVAKGSESILDSLASAIRAITAPGVKYSVAAYKYVCPRTAATLKELSAVLQAAWKG